MSVPKPPAALQDQCSVIRGNTLYVYTPSAFLSLPLKKNAQWSTLQNGVSVTGAICALGLDDGPGSDDALWVVGGSSTNSSSDYPGLQRYSFSSNTWKTITPITKVTQNRRGHSAVYINDSGSILVYGGSQDSTSQKSIQTFLIQTKKPFNVLSYTAENTPTISPILLPWNDTSAITFGGDQSQQIYMFNQQNSSAGWTPYGTSLPQTMKSTNDQQATLVHGTDGSIVLDLFDMSVTPNKASSIVLQDANGSPAHTGQFLGQSSGGGGRSRKRDLTLNDWPSYNDANAPSFERSGFSIAQSINGLVAITGGNSQHPLSLFDENKNSWIDNEKFFGDTNTISAQSTPTSNSSTSASSTTPTATSTPTLPPPISSHHKLAVVLGATLGSIVGFIILLIILLLIIRYRRSKSEKARAAAENDEKRRLSFADRGDPFSMEEDKTVTKPTQQIYSAVAVVNNTSKSGHARRSDSKGSDSSTRRLVPKHDALGRPGDNMEMRGLGPGVPPVPTIIAPEESNKSSTSTTYALPKRSSGWSRYFSGTPSANPSGVPAGTTKSVLTTSMLSSHSSSSHDCSNHGPTEIPPLQLGQEFNGGTVSRVVTGSPPTTSAGEVKRTGTVNSVVPSSRDSRPWTVSSMNSTGGASSIDEAIFTNQQHNDNNRWTPVDRPWTGPTIRDTATSSVYTHMSKNSETLPVGLNTIIEKNDRSASKNLPRISDPDTWPRPPKAVVVPEEDAAPGVAEIMRPMQHHNDEDEEPPSTPTAITAIPVPASTAMQYTVKKPVSKTITNSDMSWLNLGPIQPR